MNSQHDHSSNRRRFLGSASATVAAAMLAPGAAIAEPGRFAHRLHFLAEGTVPPQWVLSLLPLNLPQLPPGTLIKARYEFPAHAYPGKDVLSLYIYLLVPAAPPAEIPVSAFHVAVEDVAVDEAAFGGAVNPKDNLALSGRVLGVEVASPFGDLKGRTFSMACGFHWSDSARSSAVFKLLAGSVAGSHVTVVDEANGYIRIKRP